jgi:hypothetical protein
LDPAFFVVVDFLINDRNVAEKLMKSGLVFMKPYTPVNYPNKIWTHALIY